MKITLILLFLLTFFPPTPEIATPTFAAPSSQDQSTQRAPWGLPRVVHDGTISVSFEVHAPWNILDGKAEQLGGKLWLADDENPGSLRANVTAQKVEFSAGLRAAGQLVAAWLRANPPTPGRFVISNASVGCSPDEVSHQKPCKGSVDGILTIWNKNYNIDIPIEIKRKESAFMVEGSKKIHWGEYGFGDPDSTIASLKPVFELAILIDLPQED